MFVPKTSWAVSAVIVSACITGISGTVDAATYYAQGTAATNNLANWWDQPTGGGNHPAAFSSNTFDSQGFRVNPSPADFANSTLILRAPLSGIATNSLVNKQNNAGTAFTVKTLDSFGGSLFSGVNTATNVYMVATNFINESSGTLIDLSNGGAAEGRPFNLAITTLTGSGDFTLKSGADSTINASGTGFQFSATNATGYTGNITFTGAGRTTLEFKNDLISHGGLVLTSKSVINLHQNVTFASLIINGTPLGPGTYSFSTLNANYDSLFVDGGSGSITVPEPTTLSMAGLAGLSGLVLRRRRQI